MTIGDPCIARHGSDGQVRCAACRLVWDRNDPDPPTCPRRLVDAPALVPMVVWQTVPDVRTRRYHKGVKISDMPLRGEYVPHRFRCFVSALPFKSGER